MYLIILICGLSLYFIGNHLKSIAVCLQLNGPRALPFLGNVMMILDKNSKSQDACVVVLLFHLFTLAAVKINYAIKNVGAVQKLRNAKIFGPTNPHS